MSDQPNAANDNGAKADKPATKPATKKVAKKVSALSVLLFVLTTVHEEKTCTINEVAGSCVISRQRASRVLKELCSSRLLRRVMTKSEKGVTAYTFKQGSHKVFKVLN